MPPVETWNWCWQEHRLREREKVQDKYATRGQSTAQPICTYNIVLSPSIVFMLVCVLIMFERHIIILKSHHRIKNASSPQFATDTQYTHVHEHMICSTRRRRKERERESESERERVKRIGAYSINAHVAVWRHFAQPRTYTHRHSRTYLYTVRSERTMTREISLLPTFPWAKLKLFFSTCSSAIRYTAIDTDQQKKNGMRVCSSVPKSFYFASVWANPPKKCLLSKSSVFWLILRLHFALFGPPEFYTLDNCVSVTNHFKFSSPILLSDTAHWIDKIRNTDFISFAHIKLQIYKYFHTEMDDVIVRVFVVPWTN